MTAQDVGRAEPTNLVRSSAWLGFAQLVGWLTTPIVLLLIARNLGAPALGSLGLVLSVWAIVGVVIDQGLDADLVRRVARSRDQARPLVRSAAGLLWRNWIVAVPIVLGGQALFLSDRHLTPLFAVIAVQTIGNGLAGVLGAAARGLELMREVSVAAGVAKLVTLASSVGLLFLTDELWLVGCAFIAGATTRLTLTWMALRRYDDWAATSTRINAGELARTASMLLLINLVVVAYTQVDIIMMAGFVDAEVMGWYTAAERFYTTCLFAANVVIGAALPSMARIAKDQTRSLDLSRRSVRVLMVLAGPFAVGLAVVADRAAPVLFGDAFTSSGGVLALFALAIPATYLLIVLGGLAIATGRERVWVQLQLAALGTTIALNVVLIPLADRRFGNGALGGAWTTLAIEYAMLPIAVRLIQPELFDSPTVRHLLRVGVSAAVMGGVVLAASAALPLAALVLVGAIAYGGILFAVGGVPFDDVRQLREVAV